MVDVKIVAKTAVIKNNTKKKLSENFKQFFHIPVGVKGLTFF